MSSALQNRLVGTVIVVAIAVIFLPDLLDGKQESNRNLFVFRQFVVKYDVLNMKHNHKQNNHKTIGNVTTCQQRDYKVEAQAAASHIQQMHILVKHDVGKQT